VLLAVVVVLTLAVGESTSVGWLLALAGVAGLASVENERWPVFGPAARCLEAVVWAVGIRATGGNESPLLPYLIAPVFAAGLANGVRAAVVTAACGVLTLVAGAQANDAGPSNIGLTISLVEWVFIALLIGLVGAWIRNLQIRAAGPAAVHYAQAHKLLEQLQTVATKLPGSLDPVTVAAGLLDDIGGVAKYDEAAVLVNADGDHLVPLAHDGAERVTWDLARRRTGPFAEAWTTRSKYLRLTKLPRTGAAAEHTGHGSALVVPLRFGTRTLGVVALEAYAPDAYPKKVAKTVRRLVFASSLPLATAGLFDDVRELATAEERRRLSREIHDGIAQELASLGYNVDDLLAEARDGAGGRVIRNLGLLRNRISELMAEVRLSIFSLRSDVDRHGGLGAALAEYVRTIGAESRLTVNLMLAESPTRLPAQTEAELLRIAQQAISNARKHAGARTLWVKLWVEPPCARLIVEDDGVGIGEPRRDRYGLEIMHERAARVRARLALSPRKPTGTVVEILLAPPRAGDLFSIDLEPTALEFPLGGSELLPQPDGERGSGAADDL
jgi:signal transduction histidine kinase